jgi:hypothetical protein
MRFVPGLKFHQWLKLSLILIFAHKKILNTFKNSAWGNRLQNTSTQEVVTLHGWSNSSEMFNNFYLKRFRNIKIKYVYRKDITQISNARGFELKLDLNQINMVLPNWNNSILGENLYPVRFDFPSEDEYGYFDGAKLKIKTTRSLNIFDFFRNFYEVKLFILFSRIFELFKFIDVPKMDLSKYQHIFHLKFIDFFLEKYSFQITLKLLESLNILGFFLEYFSISDENNFVCDYCSKSYSSESLLILQTNFLNSYSNDSSDSLENDNFWKFLKNVKLINNRFIVKGNKVFISNLNHNPISLFISDWWRFGNFNRKSANFITFGNSQARNVELGEVILPLNSNQDNWFHFIFEGVVDLIKLPRSFSKIPILLPSGVHKNFIDILNLMDFNEIQLIDSSATYKIKQLHIPIPQTWLSDVPLSKFTKAKFEIDISGLHLANQYFSQLLITSTIPDELLSSKIAILRSTSNTKNRTLINFNNTVSLLEKNGFKVFNFYEIGIREQIQICRKAKLVVLQGGSDVANLLFMSRGTKVIILNSFMTKDFNFFKEIGDALGIEIIDVFDGPGFSNPFLNTVEAIQRPYFANLKLLKSLL